METKTSLNHDAPPAAKPLLVAGLSLEEWIAKETKPHYTRFWGDNILVKPVCAETILGDGQQLIYLGTIDQRPQRWYLRIDSKTDVYADDFNVENILQPLEDEFGRIEHYGCSASEFRSLKKEGYLDYDTYKDYQQACRYPAVAWSGGHWGLVVNMVTGEVGS